MGWMGLSYTTVTPRASLQSDANNNNKDNLKVGRQSTFKVKVSGYYPCKNIQQGRKGRFSTQISWRCMLELDKGQMW